MAPASWGRKMNNKFGLMEAPDWWSKELGTWAKNQRKYGKAFKKPASQRSKPKKEYAKNTTKRHVALLDGIGFFTWLFFSNSFQKSYIVTLYRGGSCNAQGL